MNPSLFSSSRGTRAIGIVGTLLLAGGATIFAGGLVVTKGFPPQYKPPQFENAENHLQVRFLPAARDWERMDVYVPKSSKEERMPCIVFFYGGGWSGKVTWGKDNFKALLDHGYVVAMPDYVLGAQQPVPMAVWDGAAAIRYLRANAAKYRIDPERIAVMGLSAGGWLVQYLAPSDSSTLCVQGKKGESQAFFPMLEPHPAYANVPATVSAFVTDWGAGKLTKGGGIVHGDRWLGPNDPPLFTCVTVPETTLTLGVQAYRNAGAVVEVAHVGLKSSTDELVGGKNPNDFGHGLIGVTNAKYLTKDKTGKIITFGERTLQFLDEYVKQPKRASSPEIMPHGGPISGPTTVVLRSIHPTAKMVYTLDGSSPDERSSEYSGPITVKPGDALKTIAVKPGLKPSAIATADFTNAPCLAPVITTTEGVFRAKVKQPFSIEFKAKCQREVTWHLSGKITPAPPKGTAGWLSLDSKTGVLSGTPIAPGVSVLIVAVIRVDGTAIQTDARSVIVVVE